MTVDRTVCFVAECDAAPDWFVAFRPACSDHLVDVLRQQLSPSPDGRRGSTAVPVMFATVDADGNFVEGEAATPSPVEPAPDPAPSPSTSSA